MSKLSDYLRLMRISLLPTAWSNVLMGYVLVMGLASPSAGWLGLLLLLFCSSCLYIAGMVLNDVYDIELDNVERPERVLPSGRISVKNAKRLGYALFAAALLTSVLISIDHSVKGGGRYYLYGATTAVVCGLIILIYVYNRAAKHSAYGPWVMGLCRSFNVLLGGSLGRRLVDAPVGNTLFYVAGAVGLYVAGITYFARKENEAGHCRNLYIGAVCMVAAVAALILLPFTEIFWSFWFHHYGGTVPPVSPTLFIGLLAVMMFPVARKVGVALATRQPGDVKQAVITSLLTIIMIDASICWLVSPATPAYALGVACLIIPAYLMSRRIMAT